MPDAGEMNLGLESLKGFAGKVVQAALGFAGMVVFARVIGRTDFGGFYFLLSLVYIADRPIRGFGQAVEKRYSEVDANKREIVGAALLMSGVAVLIVSVGVLVLRDVLVTQTSLDAAPLVFVTVFGALALFFPAQKLLGGEGWIALQTWNDTVRSILTLGLQLAFVFAGFNAAGMGYGLAAATLLSVPIAWYFLRLTPARPSRATVTSLWRYARFSIPSAFVGKAYDRFDVILLGAIVTTGAVAGYEVAFKLTLPATFLAGVIASGLAPKISNRASKGQDVAIDITNAVSYGSVLAIPVFFGALAIPEPLVVTAYGATYADAAPFLVGLALYQVLYTQTTMYQRALAGLDLPNVQFRVNLLTLAFNLVAGIALLVVMGPIGVVVATVLAEALRYGTSSYAVRGQVREVDVLPRAVFEQVLAGVAMFAVVEALQQMVALRAWYHVVALVGVGAVVYGVVLFAVSAGFRFTLASVYRDAIE